MSVQICLRVNSKSQSLKEANFYEYPCPFNFGLPLGPEVALSPVIGDPPLNSSLQLSAARDGEESIWKLCTVQLHEGRNKSAEASSRLRRNEMSLQVTVIDKDSEQ